MVTSWVAPSQLLRSVLMWLWPDGQYWPQICQIKLIMNTFSLEKMNISGSRSWVILCFPWKHTGPPTCCCHWCGQRSTNMHGVARGNSRCSPVPRAVGFPRCQHAWQTTTTTQDIPQKLEIIPAPAPFLKPSVLVGLPALVNLLWLSSG